ncbi:MAG: NAD-dependent epimerase/dehydratase family protein [Candidatus Micrarchaeia archaeon]
MQKNDDSKIADKGNITLVTGAGGKLGNALLKVLLKEGGVVRALVKEKGDILSLPGGVIPYVGDITNKQALKDALDGCDSVFHLAAIVSAYKQKSTEIINVNVNGVRNLAEVAEASSVRHFIFPSSVDVYGIKRKEILTENSRPMPTDPYGYSKLLAENVLKEFSRSLPTTTFRIATIYGPGFEESFTKVFRAIKEGKAYIIGNGENHLALIHLYDVLQAFMLAKNAPGAGEIYNLSDGVPYTQKGLFDIAASLMGVEKVKKRISLSFLAKILGKYKGLNSDELRFLLSNRVIDITKIKSNLGFKPMININVGSKEMIDDLLKRRML